MAIILAILILVLCLMPGNKVPKYHFPHLDKMVHFVLFGTFALSMLYGFMKQTQFKLIHKQAVLWSISIGIIYGVFIEILQDQLSPSRSFEFKDILADTSGVLISFLFFQKIGKKLFGLQLK